MSSYGGGGSRDRRSAAGRPPSLFWSLLVIAAALIGGLAAAELEHASLIITIVVSIAVGAIAVFAVVRWPGQPAELTGGRSGELGHGPQRRRADDQSPTQPVPVGPPLEAPFGSSIGPGSRAVDPRYPGSETEHTRVDPRYARPEREPERETHTRIPSVVELIPFSPPRDAGNAQQPGGQEWWQQPGAPPPSAEGRRAPAPDLSTYLDSTVIAQCPRCGAFDLDINDSTDPWAFHCRACDNTWTWRPGTPWPAVRVAPRLRKEPRPPSS